MLQLHIDHEFKYPVWRLETDTASNIIYAEIREPADKRVSFASISLETGKVFFADLQTEERWLTGIETAFDGVLLLHNYQSEAAPAHKGLIAIDGQTGKSLWNNYTHAFDHLSVNGPVVYDTRLQPARLLIVDIKAGTMTRPFDPSIDLANDNKIVLPERMSNTTLPSFSLQLKTFGETIDYLDFNNFRIVSLHAFAEGALQQLLYVLTKDNKIVYQDLLNKDIQKLQPESFLMRMGQLIYLTDKSRLKVLNLYTF